jgi:hypothetical protein
VLPDYFEAPNRDFRYQLTVIGQFARAMVASKINNNSFIIKTDQPSVEVSWQVTGIRQDAYANANRIKVEEEKPVAERGSLLNAEVYGQSAKQAEEGDLPPEVEELIKKHREQREEKPLYPQARENSAPAIDPPAVNPEPLTIPKSDWIANWTNIRLIISRRPLPSQTKEAFVEKRKKSLLSGPFSLALEE